MNSKLKKMTGFVQTCPISASLQINKKTETFLFKKTRTSIEFDKILLVNTCVGGAVAI
jgi:hypothetical protein